MKGARGVPCDLSFYSHLIPLFLCFFSKVCIKTGILNLYHNELQRIEYKNICEKELKGKGLKTDTQIHVAESVFAYIAATKRSF